MDCYDFAALHNASPQAANRNMSPVFACTITEEDRASSKRTGISACCEQNCT